MEKSHIVSRHDKSMGRIISGILDMGDLVISQLRQATDALDNFEADTVDQLIAADRTINGMYKDIYSRAERLIALRQPMALDLRQALSPIDIASNLERIGDHAKSTAKRARKLAGQTPDPALLSLVQNMSDSVQNMLREVLRAYNDSDTELAAEIRLRDLDVDQLNKDVFASAVAAIEMVPDQAETYIHLILLARGFERVGDHVVNIARDVHQIVTGDDLKAADSIN
jgi:phosphate transport system protein